MSLLATEEQVDEFVSNVNKHVVEDPVRIPDILEITPEMLDFIPLTVRSSDDVRRRVGSLIDKLVSAGYYEGTYAPKLTLTAKETFERKRGNCLAFTSMFVALARAAGIDAQFQIVPVAVSYDGENGILQNQQHVNVLVQEVDSRLHGRYIVIDFNTLQADNRSARVISDERATALFLNNLGIDFLMEDDYVNAFSHIRTAIDVDPSNPALWVNLGTYHLMQDDLESAKLANLHALRLDDQNTAALSSLQIVYSRLGNTELANQLRSRISILRGQNPYYHFALAQLASDRKQHRETLVHLERVLSMRKDDPRIFELMAHSQTQLGDYTSARKNLRRALIRAKTEKDKSRYQERLAELAI